MHSLVLLPVKEIASGQDLICTRSRINSLLVTCHCSTSSTVLKGRQGECDLSIDSLPTKRVYGLFMAYWEDLGSHKN